MIADVRVLRSHVHWDQKKHQLSKATFRSLRYFINAIIIKIFIIEKLLTKKICWNVFFLTKKKE
jgi:hypothetical protein